MNAASRDPGDVGEDAEQRGDGEDFFSFLLLPLLPLALFLSFCSFLFHLYDDVGEGPSRAEGEEEQHLYRRFTVCRAPPLLLGGQERQEADDGDGTRGRRRRRKLGRGPRRRDLAPRSLEALPGRRHDALQGK